ncbi:MAG TPA: galactose-1-phosphate uridylyltransferase [Elusimicrobia bacterium]|nr:galactose-1-phosphate uridylyltransferase [Elusimicrobiota bacterium]HBT61404.1 galactose-1-phosphate uridylyltransferase [Elusimicrobiota bacterium]
MPELRQNLATKEWVIIATERALRPEDFHSQRKPRPALPERLESCPFCPGNEARTGEDLFSLNGPRGWRVRAVRNKFPALIPDARLDGPTEGLYRRLAGLGRHEVIIESPSHSEHLAHMAPENARQVFFAYRERFRAAQQDPHVALTLVFKNHGEGAGTSLEHPHSQIIGSSVVPANIRHRMDEAEKYHAKNGSCVFCDMIEEELKQKLRILADTRFFTAFVLFAALSPFHIWILPKRHTASFGEAGDDELADLSGVMQVLLRKLYSGLGDPDYNFVIQSCPQDRGETKPFHWYLSLVVRLSKAAGFELGSGMFINTSLPERSAAFLNSLK